MTWITATLPPTAGVYDVTLQTGHGRNCKRATASAYWPGRRNAKHPAVEYWQGVPNAQATQTSFPGSPRPLGPTQ